MEKRKKRHASFVLVGLALGALACSTGDIPPEATVTLELACLGESAEAVFERVGSAPVSMFGPYPRVDFSAFDSAGILHGQTSDPYELVYLNQLEDGSGDLLVFPFAFSGYNSVLFG